MAAGPSAGEFWRRLWWSLAGRIWLTNLALVLLMAALSVVASLRLAVLERSVNSVLSRNYRSIEAGNRMVAAVSALRAGDLAAAEAAAEFNRWLVIQQHNITEPGESALTAEIALQGNELFAKAASGTLVSRDDADRISKQLAELIELNRHAMFSADRRTVQVARRFRTELLALVALAVILLGASSYALGRTLVSRPLGELRQTLRQIDDEQSLRAMQPPESIELAELAREFNAMVARLQTGFRTRLEELNRERSKTNAIIESIEDGLLVLDHTGTVVHINEVACAILDLEAGVLGEQLGHLGERSPHAARLIAALESNRGRAGAAIEFNVFIRGRDHTYLARELPWSGPEPLRDLEVGRAADSTAGGQNRLGTIVLLQDVTLIRDQERMHNNVIATLSHELKTPLTSLTIGSELLAESPAADLSARQREILTTLREDAGRLQAIASDLLDASRSSAARISVERRPITLESIVREVCKPLSLQAEDKGIRFEVIAEERAIPIWGDPIKLPWLISNLVGNALRYTPAEGRITVQVERAERVARAIVTDTGPGIPADLLGRIFEPYAQFPDNPARAGSAGLGLYIAKEIVEAHNGRIFVDSAPGRGSCFIVEIPLREQALG